MMSLPAPVGHEWPVRRFPTGTVDSRASPRCSTSPPTGRRTELHWNATRHAEIFLLIAIKDPWTLPWQSPDEDAQSTQRSDQRGRSKHVCSKVTRLSCSHCRRKDGNMRSHMYRYTIGPVTGFNDPSNTRTKVNVSCGIKVGHKE